MWAAAGTGNQRRRANQHITGRSVAVDARHGGPLAAANLVGTGELYAYALCLAAHLLERQGGLRQLHIDIMCKWRPWSSKVLDKLAGAADNEDPGVQRLHQQLMANNAAALQAWRNMRMVNAAAHGSLHAQSCQVKPEGSITAQQPHTTCMPREVLLVVFLSACSIEYCCVTLGMSTVLRVCCNCLRIADPLPAQLEYRLCQDPG